MTIRFNCPKCDELIAFADKYSGKQARCTSCGQRFIIPSEDKATPKKVEQPAEKAEPEPGFYRAVFIDSWKLFVRPQNAAGLVFVIAAVCFKFFTGHTDYSFTMGYFRVQAPVGLVVTLSAWGCLFWYYMEIICSTALDTDELPDVYMGGLFGFIWNVIKSLTIFAFGLVAVLLPCAIFISISRSTGVVSHVLGIAGLFAFPMAVLTFSVCGDVSLVFQPNYIFKPVAKAFWPYLLAAGLFILTWELELRTVGYGRLIGSDNLIIGLNLLANLAVQMLAIVAMRSIGLFYRHYSCYFPW
jgi:DNA-directed RNA polymerase subunit RPC12/RpoP